MSKDPKFIRKQQQTEEKKMAAKEVGNRLKEVRLFLMSKSVLPDRTGGIFMQKTIMCSNQKGGTGKSVTAVNLSFGLAAEGYRIRH